MWPTKNNFDCLTSKMQLRMFNLSCGGGAFAEVMVKEEMYIDVCNALQIHVVTELISFEDAQGLKNGKLRCKKRLQL